MSSSFSLEDLQKKVNGLVAFLSGSEGASGGVGSGSSGRKSQGKGGISTSRSRGRDRERSARDRDREREHDRSDRDRDASALRDRERDSWRGIFPHGGTLPTYGASSGAWTPAPCSSGSGGSGGSLKATVAAGRTSWGEESARSTSESQRGGGREGGQQRERSRSRGKTASGSASHERSRREPPPFTDLRLPARDGCGNSRRPVDAAHSTSQRAPHYSEIREPPRAMVEGPDADARYRATHRRVASASIEGDTSTVRDIVVLGPWRREEHIASQDAENFRIAFECHGHDGLMSASVSLEASPIPGYRGWEVHILNSDDGSRRCRAICRFDADNARGSAGGSITVCAPWRPSRIRAEEDAGAINSEFGMRGLAAARRFAGKLAGEQPPPSHAAKPQQLSSSAGSQWDNRHPWPANAKPSERWGGEERRLASGGLSSGQHGDAEEGRPPGAQSTSSTSVPSWGSSSGSTTRRRFAPAPGVPAGNPLKTVSKARPQQPLKQAQFKDEGKVEEGRQEQEETFDLGLNLERALAEAEAAALDERPAVEEDIAVAEEAAEAHPFPPLPPAAPTPKPPPRANPGLMRPSAKIAPVGNVKRVGLEASRTLGAKGKGGHGEARGVLGRGLVGRLSTTTLKPSPHLVACAAPRPTAASIRFRPAPSSAGHATSTVGVTAKQSQPAQPSGCSGTVKGGGSRPTGTVMPSTPKAAGGVPRPGSSIAAQSSGARPMAPGPINRAGNTTLLKGGLWALAWAATTPTLLKKAPAGKATGQASSLIGKGKAHSNPPEAKVRRVEGKLGLRSSSNSTSGETTVGGNKGKAKGGNFGCSGSHSELSAPTTTYGKRRGAKGDDSDQIASVDVAAVASDGATRSGSGGSVVDGASPKNEEERVDNIPDIWSLLK